METTDIKKFKNRNDKSVRLIAIHLAKNGLGDHLENILINVIEPTRQEIGNITVVLHRSMDNPDEFMFDEIWVDKESLETHLKQPYIISAVEQMMCKSSLLLVGIISYRQSSIRSFFILLSYPLVFCRQIHSFQYIKSDSRL